MHPGNAGGGIRCSRPAGNQHQRRDDTTYNCQIRMPSRISLCAGYPRQGQGLGVSNPQEPIGGCRSRYTDGPERAPLFPTVAGNRAEGVPLRWAPDLRGSAVTIGNGALVTSGFIGVGFDFRCESEAILDFPSANATSCTGSRCLFTHRCAIAGKHSAGFSGTSHKRTPRANNATPTPRMRRRPRR